MPQLFTVEYYKTFVVSVVNTTIVKHLLVDCSQLVTISVLVSYIIVSVDSLIEQKHTLRVCIFLWYVKIRNCNNQILELKLKTSEFIVPEQLLI